MYAEMAGGSRSLRGSLLRLQREELKATTVRAVRGRRGGKCVAGDLDRPIRSRVKTHLHPVRCAECGHRARRESPVALRVGEDLAREPILRQKAGSN